jgi:RNA polymerase sigma-70 factor (ECF subfamily)
MTSPTPAGRAVVADAVLDAAHELADFEAELRPLLRDGLRLATGMLLSGADAEDAVQEACLRAWRRRDNRRHGTDLRPWFLAIVANQCRETRRSRWARLIHFGGTDTPSDLAAAATDAAAVLDLRTALAQLPYRPRLAVVARYYLDLPHEQVAALLGCSVDAAKTLVHRTTARLQRALDTTEVER